MIGIAVEISLTQNVEGAEHNRHVQMYEDLYKLELVHAIKHKMTDSVI